MLCRYNLCIISTVNENKQALSRIYNEARPTSKGLSAVNECGLTQFT